MAKLLDYLNNLNKKKFGAIFLSLCFFASVAIFILPQFKKTTKLNLNTGDVTITANNQDSLGVSTTTQFTVKSTGELTLSDLKANLSIFPETEFNVEQVSPQEYTIIPKITLKGNRVYNIKIKTAQKDLSWAFQTKNNFRVTQSLPRDKSSSVPVNTGIEIVFSHENWQEAKDLFSISPNTKGRFERHKKTFSFVPESLKADTLYTVTLKKGLKLNGSTEQLESDYQFQFETGSDSPYDPQISLSKSYYEFSTSTPPAFDLYVSDGDNQKINVNLLLF